MRRLKLTAGVYVVVYVAIVCLFLLNPINIKTSIVDILPWSGVENALKDEVFYQVTDNYTAQVNILFGVADGDLQSAKTAGLYFKERLADMNNVPVRFVMEPDLRLLTLLGGHNYHLLSDNYRAALLAHDYRSITDQSLTLLYSPVKANVLSLIEDPFLLSTDFIMNMGLLKSGFSLNSGILTASHADQTYAFMMVNLDKQKIFLPTYLISSVNHLFAARQLTLERHPDVDIIITGVPIHSYIATQSSSQEINFISVLSLICIMLISFIIFRSIKCFIYALIVIGLSFALAFAATHLIFGSIHILVLVFGISLIGLCIDYHLHFFVEIAYKKNALAAMSNIKKAIALSLLTSTTGFLVMLLTDINILSQMAVFALIGLGSAYVIIRVFYPLLLSNNKTRDIPQFAIAAERLIFDLVAKIFRQHFALKIALIIIIFATGAFTATVSSDLRNLYKPNPVQLAKDALFAQISQTGSAPVIFIIAHNDTETVLTTEEQLRVFLDAEVGRGNISGYKAISQLVPSMARQSANHLLLESFFAAEMPGYAETLGLNKDAVQNIQAHFNAQKDTRLILTDVLENDAVADIKSLWLEFGELQVSVVLVENAQDKTALANHVASMPNVYFSDKMAEISQLLQTSQNRAFYAILLTAVVIFCVIWVCYRNLRKTVVTLLPAILAVIMTVGILGFVGITLTLFNVLALFLIICFGVDYAIFRMETHHTVHRVGVGVMLSCLTTIVSFGMLAFTSFEVTKSIGQTLSIGILLAYLLSPLAVQKSNRL